MDPTFFKLGASRGGTAEEGGGQGPYQGGKHDGGEQVALRLECAVGGVEDQFDFVRKEWLDTEKVFGFQRGSGGTHEAVDS